MPVADILAGAKFGGDTVVRDSKETIELVAVDYVEIALFVTLNYLALNSL